MSSKPIIEIKNIGKKYNISHQRGGYVALRDVLAGILRNPFKFAKQKAKQVAGLETKEEFWALRNINLEIQKGDIIGIIGHNGAGKSTLLKILTGITPPTEGEIIMRGRVASLLEVGTGFHPELTGRENIFLNGAILGMTKKEIVRKFDEIVTFAGIEKFLDTPVKYYSSGMYVRLAFSVAAHMEPDILLVDEVLAVGDAEFQKKCLGKMEEVTKSEGRTIFFVSHNMAAIEQLCTKCIIIEKGRIVKFSDNVKEVTHQYLYGSGGLNNTNSVWISKENNTSNAWFKPIRLSISSDRKNSSSKASYGFDDEIWLHIDAEVQELDPSLTVGYAIYNEDNQLIYWTFNTDQDESSWIKIGKGGISMATKIPSEILNEGTYRVDMIAALHNRSWILKPDTTQPSVSFRRGGRFSNSPYWINKRPGIIAPLLKWELIRNKKS